jgi:non-heme chloroperoxidase
MSTGEVARHLRNHGSDRARKAALLAPIPPFTLKTPDNLEGID